MTNATQTSLSGFSFDGERRRCGWVDSAAATIIRVNDLWLIYVYNANVISQPLLHYIYCSHYNHLKWICMTRDEELFTEKKCSCISYGEVYSVTVMSHCSCLPSESFNTIHWLDRSGKAQRRRNIITKNLSTVDHRYVIGNVLLYTLLFGYTLYYWVLWLTLPRIILSFS